MKQNKAISKFSIKIIGILKVGFVIVTCIFILLFIEYVKDIILGRYTNSDGEICYYRDRDIVAVLLSYLLYLLPVGYFYMIDIVFKLGVLGSANEKRVSKSTSTLLSNYSDDELEKMLDPFTLLPPSGTIEYDMRSEVGTPNMARIRSELDKRRARVKFSKISRNILAYVLIATYFFMLGKYWE